MKQKFYSFNCFSVYVFVFLQLFLIIIFPLTVSAQTAPTYSFKSSNLKGVSFTTNPTSLQFGPDSRLYVSEQKGLIRAYTIVRDSANHYSVTATETISIINQIPNHNDDGSLNTGLNTRQITGILLRGTAANPIIYVSSSDSRYGGPSGSVNLDTNSGIISTLTWDGTKWVKIDLVRGLPRSNENHSTNGLQLDDKTNILYAAQGGNTNAGSPSHDFDYTGEYALSAAILSIDLNVIKSMPVRGSGNTAYIYDLPTLDDPTRPNNSNGTDVNDPFGGNSGLNQAKIVSGGPVQIYSPGYRNSYDIVITKARNLYTIDNGANQGWGGYPDNEGTSNVTNKYLPGEPGSTTATATQLPVNNLDNLHFIGNLDTYKPGSFYGGHPNPIRANPAGSGLYTKSATDSEWRYSTTGAFPLPRDWPPVSNANPIEGNFLMPGVADGALLTFKSSTNGIAEYTASNFNGALQGNLFACGFNAGKVFRIKLTSDGKGVTNSTGASTLNLDQPFASNFGADPLDITAEDDSSIFPGTMWIAVYGAKTITIFEPSDFRTCTGLYNSADDDGDNYTNSDEMDNNTNPCSALSVPPDWDHDFVSDLNDPDDDNDGIPDSTDFYCRDSLNGVSTTIPIAYDLFNNNPGTGFFGQGFTGLMTNYHTDYLNLYDESNLIAGGTAGVFTIKSVSAGDALGNLNNQENAFQFGVKASNSLPFTIVGSMIGPFFNNQTPSGYQSQGIYIGNGDQDNYLKIAVNANGGAGGIQVVFENAGVPVISQFPLKSGGLSAASIDLYLYVDPVAGTVQPQYSVNKGQVINAGSPIQVSGALLAAIKNVYAIGVIATSRGGSPFNATWDFIYVTNTPTANAGPDATVTLPTNNITLNGSGTDPYGTITTYSWSQVSGPNTASFSPSSTAQSVTVNGLVQGTYIFTLNVTDDLRAVSKADSVIITVNPAPVNQAPISEAGPDITITLPANSTVLSGSGTATNSISSYTWSQVSGPNTATFSPGDTAQNPTVSGLVQGSYIFALNVTDNNGSISKPDSVNVTVGGIVLQTWQTLTPSSGAIIGREENGYVQAGNKFYLMGGRGIVAVQEYNPANKSWTNKSNPPIEMNHFQPVALNGLIYATGSMNGLFPHEKPLSKVYVYNSASDKWFTGSAIPVTRRRGAAGAVAYNNKIYVVGGITDGHWYGWVKWFDEYDPATNTWKVLPDAPRVRDHFQAVVINNKLYIAGGRRSFDSTGHLFDLTVPEVDVYDFAASSWSTLPAGSNLPIPRAGASNVVSGNQLLVIGGESGIQTVAHKETHALDVTTNTWRRLADLQTGRHGTGAVFSDNSIYIASGPSSRGGKPLLTTQEVYYMSAPASNNGNPITQSQLTSASSVSFTGVAVNSSGNKTVTLTNGGSSQDILITSVSISGASSFTYTTPYPFPFTVSAGKSVNISVTFKPVISGTQTANFVINHSGQNNSNTVALSGGQSGSSNIPPIANAGADKAITLPANSVVLSGSGTDADGTISSYTWKQISSPNNTATFFPNNAAQNPTVSGLIQGTYIFALTVADNLGASSRPDSVIVTVNGANSGITFTLINAATNQAIQTLNEGNVLNLATLPSTKLNIQANTTPATVGSVVFNLSGAQIRKQIETAAPYALFGDVSGKFNAWTPAIGYYALKATPYSASGGGGTAGTSLTLNFSVINQAGFAAAKRMSGEASIKRNVQLEQLMLKSEANTLKAYPNPSREGHFTVLVPAKFQGEVSYSLFSILGTRLAGGKLLLMKPVSSIDFDFSREMIASGMYYLHLESNKQKAYVELMRSK